MNVKESDVSNFLGNEYLNYAFHTLENRSVPSCIDGMKSIQRKIFFTSLNNIKNISNKVSTLAGKVISEAAYHNGNVSCEEAIVLMTQDFKNNIPYFKGTGQFGSLKNPFSSSSRYISVKLSEESLLLFKDDFLLEHHIEDSMKVEPHFYLPIIPIVVINGTSGIALGYYTKILNRDPKDVITYCMNLLNNKSLKNISMSPKLNGFEGTISQDEVDTKKWYFTGKFEKVKSNTIKITEIPPSMTYEKYENLLEDLITNKFITGYENLSSDKINYVVKLNREKINTSITDDEIIKIFKLRESQTENFTTLNETGKLKIFDNVEDIIKYFVNFRLGYYQKRKDFMLNKMIHELKVLGNKGKFIKLILDGKIIVNNRSKSNITDQINENKLDEIDGDHDYLLRMAIYSLTLEMFEKLKEDFKSKKEEIEKTKLTDPKEMYLYDLSELKNKLK